MRLGLGKGVRQFRYGKGGDWGGLRGRWGVGFWKGILWE